MTTLTINRDKINVALADLCDEYFNWQVENGLHLGAAEEHVFDQKLTADQREWLKGFCDRWDDTATPKATDLWGEVTEAEYYAALGDLPPALQLHNGFLVGEACDTRACAVTETLRRTFRAFKQENGKFFRAAAPLTIPEFKKEIA